VRAAPAGGQAPARPEQARCPARPRRRFPLEERGALLMVARLTEALALTLRVHLLQAEHDCNTAPLDLPGDLQVPPPAPAHAGPA